MKKFILNAAVLTALSSSMAGAAPAMVYHVDPVTGQSGKAPVESTLVDLNRPTGVVQSPSSGMPLPGGCSGQGYCPPSSP